MELSNLDFEPAQRSAWQVFDLSLLMVRRWGIALFVLWFLQAVPVFLVMTLLLDTFWAGMTVWWLKPLFERPLLHYASQAAFRHKPTLRQCLTSLKVLGLANLISMLTWRRFSLKRAYFAPVDQLEGLRGTARSKRVLILDSASRHLQSFWLILCLHIEFILLAGLLFIAYSLIPQPVQFDLNFQDITDLSTELDITTSIAGLITYGVVAPIYVMGGFLGYLHSRIHLEAWDIEIAFKRMAQRLAAFSPALAVVVICASLLPDSSVKADVLDGISPDDIQLQVNEIYQQGDVVDRSTTWIPVDSGDEMDLDLPEWLVDALAAILNWFVDTDFKSLDIVFWFAILLVLLFVLWKLAGVKVSKPAHIPVNSPVAIVPDFIRDIPVQHWPEDLLEAARESARAGDTRLSLAYLLRHFLILAQSRFGVSLRSSMTEGECESQLKQHLPQELFPHYQRLFVYWIQQAWAHKPVSTDQIEALIQAFTESQQPASYP